MVTVIVPAHNEGRVIGRMLGQLVSDARPGELDVIVVPNGCTDDTGKVAASFGSPVRVLSIDVASKAAALRAGDAAARSFPRLYVDADVELRAADVRALVAALKTPGVLAAGPQRVLTLSDSAWPVRWYYDVWLQLPETKAGLYGRGVIAVSSIGHARIAQLPALLSDDLAASLAFDAEERAVIDDAQVVIHPPRTLGDLIRRRARVSTGVIQIEREKSAPASTARTRPAHLLAILKEEPLRAPQVAVFAAVTVLARLKAQQAGRRGDYSTWLRDESSRQQ